MKQTSRCPRLLSSLCLGALMLASTVVQALPEDKEQPINIAADSAELNDGKRTAIYTGAVKLVQGTLELEADKLTLYADDKGDINRIVATGKPAHFQQQHQAGAPLTHGYGLTIEFEVTKDLLTLTEQAKLVRASDTFTGQQIKVNTSSNVIHASSDENKPSSRVEMVIQPRSKKKDNAQ